MFRKFVVGLDGSETSEDALRLAFDLAQKYGSEIHLVHTPQPQTVAFAVGALAGSSMPDDKKSAHDRDITISDFALAH